MKRYIFLISLSLFFSKTSVSYSENIQTGNASAQSSVETKIQGSGSVTTHIEVTANGEKKILDASKPGSYSVSVESNSNSNEVSPSSTPSATPTIDNNNNSEKSSFISTLVKNIRNFFKRILDFF